MAQALLDARQARNRAAGQNLGRMVQKQQRDGTEAPLAGATDQKPHQGGMPAVDPVEHPPADRRAGRRRATGILQALDPFHPPIICLKRCAPPGR